MGTDQDDGLYVSAHRRAQRRRQIGVAVVGAAAVLSGGAYAVTTLLAHRDSTVTGEAEALAPMVTPATRMPVPPATMPARGPRPASLSAVRQSSRPSPTPVPTLMPDREVAAAQVSRLLAAPRTVPSDGVAAAGEVITVANERGLDGSAIRVVSARYDLTGGGRRLIAADDGRPAGVARCTQNFRIGGGPVAQTRSAVLLCWRVSAGKSVVTVATREEGRPAAVASVAVIERVWGLLG